LLASFVFNLYPGEEVSLLTPLLESLIFLLQYGVWCCKDLTCNFSLCACWLSSSFFVFTVTSLSFLSFSIMVWLCYSCFFILLVLTSYPWNFSGSFESDMLIDEQLDVVHWLDVPFVWRHLKTLKHAINEDKTLHKFNVEEILNAKYACIPNYRTCEVINQWLLIINHILRL